MTNPVLSAPYWVSLDPLVDVERLTELHEQFCFGFAKGIRSAGGYGSFHSKNDHLSGKLKELSELPSDDPIKVRCSRLNGYEQSLYIGLLHHGMSVSETLTVTVLDEPNTSLGLKHDADYFSPHHSNYALFDFFIEWLEDQDIFDTYGRVYGFMNCPYQDAPAHKDMEEPDKPCDFIWIRTQPKPFFIQKYKSSTEAERYYVDANVVWFNPGMYHGAGFTDYYAFSIRVDGVFTREFRKRIYNL